MINFKINQEISAGDLLQILVLVVGIGLAYGDIKADIRTVNLQQAHDAAMIAKLELADAKFHDTLKEITYDINRQLRGIDEKVTQVAIEQSKKR